MEYPSKTFHLAVFTLMLYIRVCQFLTYNYICMMRNDRWFRNKILIIACLHLFFSMAIVRSAGGIFSMAYLSAVRGMIALYCIT